MRYRFLTAYGPPFEFLDHLAAQNPSVAFDLTFDVELLGGGSGAWRGGRRVQADEYVPL